MVLYLEDPAFITQLLIITELWTRSLDKNTLVDTAYLDFKQIFDSVPHHRLLRKLEAYGITGHVLKWIEE